MKIQSIELKNFASYGNKIQKIEFSDDSSELFLTLGKNGEGKTTIANAIVFGLYGKVEGVRMADLPNRINKELWVRIKLECKSTKIVIERGLAPGIFKVTLNGVEFDKAGKKSVQDYLEEELFGIPYHVFKNIIILSVNDFKSFLTMTNSDKRQIIDRMFGFSILNEMQQSIREERKGLKTELDIYSQELNQLNENIISVNLKLNQLLVESAEKDQKKIQSLKDSLVKYNENKIKLEEAQQKISTSIGTLTSDLQEKQSDYSSLKYRLESLQKKFDLYENNTCPTCESELTGDFHDSRKEIIKEDIEKLPIKMKDAESQVLKIKEEVANLRDKDRSVRDKVSTLNTNIRSFKNELIAIKDSLNGTADFSHLEQIISDFQIQEKEKEVLKDFKSVEYGFLEYVEEVLGEDGVKNLAIKTILPGLNANIAAMTQTMHLHFHIRFDEKFNCIINHLGEEINPLTLSTGERKKADFIIIIAIIKILKLRFPQLNLLFLDELLSSVDADGVHNILKILSQVIKESKINTFVINHSVLPHELFDKKIQIYRENGFSKFDIEAIE
jgi:DNA repair exonuclease SbcCD ATPase subunit|tara:strand:- start:1649 stop:3322 length:1674 start_codon:yes stop_codon:yes gene_type:complete